MTYAVKFRGTTDSHATGIATGAVALTDADRNRVTQTKGHISLYDDSDHNVIENNVVRQFRPIIGESYFSVLGVDERDG